MRPSWLVVPLAALLVGGMLMPACATDANDVTGCRELESARCDRAVECGLDLQGLLPIGNSPGDAVTACKLFYQDACLHGLLTTATVTSTQVNTCLNVIKATADCNYVINPQTAPACTWLNPPDAGVDTGSDATTDVVATPDVTVIYVYPDATVSDGASEAEEECVAQCDGTCLGDPNCIMNCETTCSSN